MHKKRKEKPSDKEGTSKNSTVVDKSEIIVKCRNHHHITHGLLMFGLIAQLVEQQAIESEGCGFDSCQGQRLSFLSC